MTLKTTFMKGHSNWQHKLSPSRLWKRPMVRKREQLLMQARRRRITRTRYDYVSRAWPPGDCVSRVTQIIPTCHEFSNHTILISRNLLNLRRLPNQTIHVTSMKTIPSLDDTSIKTIPSLHDTSNKNHTFSTPHEYENHTISA